MARTMALCSLPRSNPGNRLQYKRRQRALHACIMYSSRGQQQAPLRELAALDPGLGVLPKRCEPKAGCWSWERSLSEFMRALGVYRQQRREREHTTSPQSNEATLWLHMCSLIYEDAQRETTVNRRDCPTSPISGGIRSASPTSRCCGRARFELSEAVLQRDHQSPGAARHEHPYGAQALFALGLDLYLWLVYRTFPLRAPLRLTWRQVYRQFGVDQTRAQATVIKIS